MPSESAEASQIKRARGAPKTSAARASTKSKLSNSGAGVAYCLACGPDHPLQIRELSRCGFRGEGHGAWCGSCRRVYAIEVEELEPAA